MDATTAPLTCPKCGAAMRTFERSGLNVEQCTGCRGIFLDRGELERLIDAESTYYADRGFAEERGYPEDRGMARDRGFLGHRYDDDDHEEGWGRRRRRRRGGFLGELFEGGDD